MFKQLGFLSLVLCFVTSCIIAPPMSAPQRRALQTKTFDETSYDNVFKAFKNVLQDEGYIIKNQDYNGGMILATILKADNTSEWFAQMDGKQNYRTGEGFEVSVSFDRINKKATETRLTIQKVEQYSMGGTKGYEILDPKMYKSLYDKITVEIERRKAKGMS